MFSRKEFVEAQTGASPTQWVVGVALVLVLVSGTFLGIAAGLFEETRASQHLMRESQETVAAPSSSADPTAEAETTDEAGQGAKFLSVTDD